ncbi:MAG: glycosyl hydrolase [Bacteroidetes bacterium]|nr:glycosyl hydrolase [Bacteroidota bacterium]
MKTLLVLLISLTISLKAQVDPQPTPSKVRVESLQKSETANKTNLIQNIQFRNVGPIIMSGRVTDLEVNPDDPTNFYVSYATSGLWVTKNNGLSFDPIFDNEITMSIGAISVDWKTGTIWVGSGEANAFTWAGLGVFKSSDWGKSWAHVGLEETQHINQIVIHPDNPEIVWVAGMGRLYSTNPERGVFKTVDGGKSWSKTLFVSDSTGITDLIIDPNNSDILYAASWERWRKSWMRHKGGAESGIFKSIDGGETWERLNVSGSGLPTHDGVGRIGLSICASDSKILYATVDSQEKYDKEKDDDDSDKLKKDIFKTMSVKDFLNLDDERLGEFLKENDFPEKYTVDKVKKMIKDGEVKPIALYEYLVDPTDPPEDDRPIYGAELYRSSDSGKTWFRTHEKPLDGLFYSYGYVFDIIRVSPSNADKIYIAGVPILVSEDGGKTFTSIWEDNVHADHHALWINPVNDKYIINGNDGGVNISYDSGKHWYKANTEAVSQCYTVEYDMAEPYNVYTGMQDNGTWKGPSTYEQNVGYQQDGDYPYKALMGGDGFQIEVDHRDNDVVYVGWQYGNYYRVKMSTDDNKYLEIKHELGERPLRWNWETPILLSRHNEDILYIGSNRLFRSMDKGETFKPISPDLTKGGRVGGVKYGTITTISESKFKFGLIYVGTDDGNIQLTKDGGTSWELISGSLPQNYWVSRVEASSHKEGTVYASLYAYKWDNYEAHVYASDDYGKTWRRIGTDLPVELVNVVREDPENENIIYVGNQIGAYVSLNKGESFMKFHSVPNVAVFDMKIHPRDKDLILGTHGRSIYIADVQHLQELPDIMNKDLHLFKIEDAKYNSGWGEKFSPWDKPEEPKVSIPYYSNKAGKALLTIEAGEVTLASFIEEAEAGLNYFEYDLSFLESAKDDYQDYLNDLKEEDDKEVKLKKADNDKLYLQKGKYLVTVEVNGKNVSTTLEVIE